MPLILTPFRFPPFRIWIAANSVSVIGTWMQVLAANWLLLMATGSATQMGLGMLAQAVPTLLLGPWAGSLADRLPAKPLLATTQLLHALISASIGLLALSNGPIVLGVYAAMLCSGIVAAFENPALGRFGSLMVDREHLGPALAASSLSNSTGRVVGMSAGAALMAALGPGPLFLINAVSFLAVITALYPLRPAPGAEVDPVGDEAPSPGGIWSGMKYLLRDPLVIITLALAFLLGSLGRNYQVTMAAMSAGPLAGGADGYGHLSTVFAIGSMVGGVLAGRAGRFRPRHIVLVGLAMSLLQGVSGLSPGLWWFAAVLLPIAAAAVVVDTVISTRMQLDKPLAVRGRVLALVTATGAIAGAAGAPLLGWLSDALGARGALGVAGAVTVAGCLLAGLALRAVRRRDTGTAVPAVPDQRPAEPAVPAARLAEPAAPAAAPAPASP